MAYSVLSPIGSPGGPCEDPRCGHTDCAWTRTVAVSPCRLCGKPIGYETPFNRERQDDGSETFVHFACLWDEVEGRG
jgi:hypothetical protein